MRNRSPLVLAMLLAIPATPALAADYYQCRDADGTMIFSDTPCPAEAEVLRSRIYGEIVPEEEAVETAGEPAGEEIEEPVAVVEGALLTAEVRQAMASLTPLRDRLIDIHERTGAWPEALTEVDFDVDMLNRSRIEHVELAAEGAIIAHLAPRLGDNRRLELDPVPARGGTEFEWRCVSNYPQEVLHDGLNDFCQSGPVRGAPVTPL